MRFYFEQSNETLYSMKRGNFLTKAVTITLQRMPLTLSWRPWSNYLRVSALTNDINISLNSLPTQEESSPKLCFCIVYVARLLERSRKIS